MGLLPSEFLLRATPYDLELLRAYDTRFLLGDLRDDFRTGLWCSTYVNTKLKASASMSTAVDFMPFIKVIKPQQPLAVMRTNLLAWAKAHGAVIPPQPQRKPS